MRAEPNTVTALGTSASAPKPSTNSAWIRSTRHGSVCTQSLGPRESSSRWSVVLPWSRRSPRSTTGPFWRSTGSSGYWPSGDSNCSLTSPCYDLPASGMRSSAVEVKPMAGWFQGHELGSSA